MSELMQVVTAVLASLSSALSAWLAYKIAVLHMELITVKKDVKTIEVATNSMKDALVKATAEASFAAGQNDQRDNPRP